MHQFSIIEAGTLAMSEELILLFCLSRPVLENRGEELSDKDDKVEIDDVVVNDEDDDSFSFDKGNVVEGDAICASNLDDEFSKLDGVKRLLPPPFV